MRFVGLIFMALAWPGLFGLCRELAVRGRLPADWRFSWIMASLGWAVLAAIAVETASLFHQLNTPTIALLWIAGGQAIGGVFLVFTKRRSVLSPANLRVVLSRLGHDWDHEWPVMAKLLLGTTCLLAIITLLAGLATPTTNWDSLTYHMPRVMHWLQQQSVGHFATNNTRQIEFAPWAAYVIATLQLLSGGDRFANIVQWFAMVTAAVTASLIANQLLTPATRANRRIRLRVGTLAAFLVVTLPIGLVQAMTTQTDWVVTGWLLCLIALAFALVEQPNHRWLAWGIGLALALGLLSKATMFLYAALPGLALVYWWARHLSNWRRRFWIAGAVIIPVLSLNGPHWARNFLTFNSPLGSRHIMVVERNERVTPGGTASNVIRNLLLETNTGIEPLTAALNRVLLTMHRLTGRDLNDPATTYHLGEFEVAQKFVVKDSEAANPYHVALILLALAFALRHPRVNARSLGYAALFIAGFVLFCALLRWQRWHTRIHLGFLAALMPVVAVTLGTMNRQWLTAAGGVVTGGFAFVCLLVNQSRPLLNPAFTALPREAQYTAAHGFGLYESYRRMAEEIILSGCKDVGLSLGFDDAEYPVWVMLQNRGFRGRIHHYGVKNESIILEDYTWSPGLLITGPTNLPPDLAAAFPFTLDYGPARIHWSGQASHWSRLDWFDGEKAVSVSIGHQVPSIQFQHRIAGFYLRVPRPGSLTLTGNVVSSSGQSVSGNQLRVLAYGGFQRDLALNGQPITITVPVTNGTTRVSCGLLSPFPAGAGEARMEQFEWSWQPVPKP